MLCALCRALLTTVIYTPRGKLCPTCYTKLVIARARPCTRPIPAGATPPIPGPVEPPANAA